MRSLKMKITGLNKAEVLVALYNRAKIQGMGFMSNNSGFVMNTEKAKELLSKKIDFDYLNGKVMKINLSGDELDTYLYNRDNGHNAAEDAIKPLIEKMQNKSEVKFEI